MELTEKIDLYLTEKTNIKKLSQEYKDKMRDESSQMAFQKLGSDFVNAFFDVKMSDLGATEDQMGKINSWGRGQSPRSASKKLKTLSAKYKSFINQAEKALRKIEIELEEEY